MRQGDLFTDFDSAPVEAPAAHTRTGDPETSFEAAESLSEQTLSELQTKVLDWFLIHREGTDEDLQRDPIFIGLGPSTARSRRAALVELGYLRDSGHRSVNQRGRNIVIWELAV